MRIKRNNEPEGENDWITTYSDMVTLLLAFFVLLFSFSEVDAIKWQEIVESLSGDDIIIFEAKASDSILENNSEIVNDTYQNNDNKENLEVIVNEEDEMEVKNEENIAQEEGVIEEEIEDKVEVIEQEIIVEEGIIEEEEEIEDKEKVIEQEVAVEEEIEIKEELSEKEVVNEEEVVIEEEIVDEEETAIEEETIVDEEIITEEELLIQYDFDELYNDLVQYNKDENMNSEIMKSKSQIIIRLPNSILFNPGEADINSEALEVLKKLAKFIRKYDDVVDKIITEGNTDNSTIDNSVYRDNFELSLERSLSVLYFFKYDGEFKPEKLIPIGYGENNPICENDTDEGRKKNRRTDIVLVKKKNISQ